MAEAAELAASFPVVGGPCDGERWDNKSARVFFVHREEMEIYILDKAENVEGFAWWHESLHGLHCGFLHE